MLNLGLLAGMLITLLVFLGGCIPSPETGGGEAQGFDWTIIVFLVLIFGVFYFLMIRPQRKRQKEHETMVRELQKGDNVVTAGGIFGVVDRISEDSVVIKIEGGTTMRVAKGSVMIRKTEEGPRI